MEQQIYRLERGTLEDKSKRIWMKFLTALLQMLRILHLFVCLFVFFSQISAKGPGGRKFSTISNN